MKTVNSLSGGKTSSYMAAKYPADYNIFSLVCIDDPTCSPKDQAVVAYVDNKLAGYASEYGEFIATAEDDRTLVAMMDLEQFIGREIVWVRGRSFDSVLTHTGRSAPSRLPSKLFRYCTDQMKIFPIFKWWFDNIGERVKMNIGFRFDEYDRMERFMNNEKVGQYKIPVACSTVGERKQRHEIFGWRYCSFPLVKELVTRIQVEEYWRKYGYVGQDTLFTRKRKIEFPVVSNCVGCFHKKAETLATMYAMHPEKMDWFAAQENRGMGTWLDSKILYSTIKQSAQWDESMIKELGAVCDSGGCTD